MDVTKPMKVLVTGHRGYIGVHLVALLKEHGHDVIGCDLGLYDGCAWEAVTPADRDLRKDIRAIEAQDLEGLDCVMHLAAISNDPMGDLDEELTLSVNRDASVRLARLAREAGVSRFLFAGSCSVYGAGAKMDLREDDPLDPLSAYARSKVEAEAEISKLATDTFSPAFLRNATAFGHSPMLRIDLVVNNLLACAVATGEIRILSDGSPWRPLIHCKDIARAFVAFLEAPRAVSHNRAVNVGSNSQNYQVRDIAAEVQRLVPGARVVYTGEAGADPRNYRVSFDRLGQVLPHFRPAYDLASGMEELHRKLVEHAFNADDFRGDRFVRLRTLKTRLSRLHSGASETEGVR
jgi:nucleoside-diphosphate-sugar epimerase